MFGLGDITMFLALCLSGSAVFYVGAASNGQHMPSSHNFAAHASIIDPSPIATGLQIERAADGLFHMEVVLDGVRTKAILDTGATRSVLDAATAERISRLRGRTLVGRQAGGSIKTLNGALRYSVLPINDLRVQGMQMGAIDALVVQGEGVPIIIGQDVIARFASVTIKANQLMLR